MLLDQETTGVVTAAFRTVYDTLHTGFLENVYVGALEHECRKRGLRVAREVPTAVHYDGVIVGTYRVDLMIEGRIVVEVKVCASLTPDHFRQVLNYLRCTDCELALLLNFGPRPQVKRCIYRNMLKRRRS